MKKSKEIRQLEKEFNCRIRPYKNPPENLIDAIAWWPDENCIGVNLKVFNKLYKIEKRGTIRHELQHQTCCRSGCFCWKLINTFWQEYHAFKAEISYYCDNFTSRNKQQILDIIAVCLKRYSKIKDKVHYKALKKVLKIKRIRERLGLK